ncbi:carboxypeptidase-like regulatory domain-containing protein [Nocardia sp. CDC159]|uniref:alpha-amylase n=1 Tax=Nocardia pulmonis TaxID=2951408 RepID=A0A9X2EB08_9NOCA|nr:carboxypeptidase-like regulatory domain-containing protein [Nocardia pulmonis]MCM6790597.1 carboxypeptidase-like regulatory domain-containing protein [Nocardia sp. CDC159]
MSGLAAGPAVTSAGGRTIGGRVRRDDGHPVAAAALTLIDQGGHQVSRATGDDGGAYTIEPPAPGSYVLIVSAQGHQPTAVNVTAVDGGAQRFDVTLRRSGELSGVVRTSAREPVAGATVTVADLRGEVVDVAVTAADGAYACHGVAAGTYTLVAVAARMRPTATTLTVPDGGSSRFDVELAPMATLCGTVRADGRAVRDARVTVLDWSGATVATAHTDENGRYAVADLPEGEYTVVARGYPLVTAQVTVSGSRVDHDVRLGFDVDEHVELS